MLREIDREKCTGCGSCFKSCGLDVFRLDTDQTEVPPCRHACPAGVDNRAYIHLLQQGRIHEASKVLLTANPLPALTSRTCHHFCEGRCARAEVDEAVNIHALEQVVGDRMLEGSPEPSTICHTGRIGVVGSGPAGLSSAYFLNQMGYAVTVFEAGEKPGGSFRSAYPDLPREVLELQIDYLAGLGIDFNCGTTVGDGLEMNVRKLRNDGYKAFVLAPGAEKDREKRTVPPFESIATITPESLIAVDPASYATSSKDVFAAGNVIGGGRSVAHAIRDAREAAESVNRYINGWNQKESRNDSRPLVKNLPRRGIKAVPRLRPSPSSAGDAGGDRTSGSGFVFEEMLIEANRCMTCGSKAFAAYKDDCMTCYTCEMACPQGAIVVHPFKEELPRTISSAKEGPDK